MDYLLFGRSGLRVSQLCLGTMTFGTDWGWGADADECRRIFERYTDAGGNFVDTANNYTEGSSEQIVGGLIHPNRDRWVVATKYSLTIDRTDPNAGGNHRKSLVHSLEQSLRRLRTDYVDLLWLHARDPATPIEEAVRALDDQVRLGKVLYIGISDSPAWIAAQANTLAELRGWSPFVGLQIPYSLAGRDPERELVPMAAAFGLTVTPWGVLEHGALAGRAPETLRSPADALPERLERIVEALREVAENRGATPSQVAIAWLLARPGPPSFVPILGVRSEEQLVDNLGALEVDLTPDDLERLEEVSRPQLGFPRSFLESDGVRELIYGDTFARLRTATRSS